MLVLTASVGALLVFAIGLAAFGTPSAGAFPLSSHDGLYTATVSCSCQHGTAKPSVQLWVVPPNVYSATFRAYGAQGGTALDGQGGGKGGEVEATLAVTPGEVFTILVGGHPDRDASAFGTGGSNGGGNGGVLPSHPLLPALFAGAGGGGASDVKSTSGTLLLVGAGGGGGGSTGSGPSPSPDYPGGQVGASTSGGAGGGKRGKTAPNTFCGYDSDTFPAGGGGGGATQTSGGAVDNCISLPYLPRTPKWPDSEATVGGQGHGGVGELVDASSDNSGAQEYNGGGGGGGGGYFGGGGGAGSWSGSSYYSVLYFAGSWPPANTFYPADAGGGGAGGGGGSSFGPPGASYHTGVRSGDGQVTITYRHNCTQGTRCIRSLSKVQDLKGTPGNGQISLSWLPPAQGNYISHYEIVETGQIAPHLGHIHNTFDTTKTHLTLSGGANARADNGLTYSFRVYAVNPRGDGKPAYLRNLVPDPPPAAPQDVHATALGTSVRVTFVSGGAPKGAPIRTYTVTAYQLDSAGQPDGPPAALPVTVPGSSTSATIPYLLPATTGSHGTYQLDSYEVTVTANNRIGASPPSAYSNPVEPFLAPTPPKIVSVQGGNQSATVNFTPGIAYGLSPTYTATAQPAGGGNPVSATGSGPQITVSGLSNGTSYTFTVTEITNAGHATSQPSSAVTPATTPGAPTDVVATDTGPGDVSVSFTYPADGGSQITSYTVTANPVAGNPSSHTPPAQGSQSGPGTPITVSGLSSGAKYNFTVTATNGVGTGPPSTASNTVTVG